MNEKDAAHESSLDSWRDFRVRNSAITMPFHMSACTCLQAIFVKP